MLDVGHLPHFQPAKGLPHFIIFGEEREVVRRKIAWPPYEGPGNLCATLWEIFAYFPILVRRGVGTLLTEHLECCQSVQDGFHAQNRFISARHLEDWMALSAQYPSTNGAKGRG
jgi:hypothetical protein